MMQKWLNLNNTWHLGTAPLPIFVIVIIVVIIVIIINVGEFSTLIVCGTIKSEGEDTGASIVRA